DFNPLGIDQLYIGLPSTYTSCSFSSPTSRLLRATPFWFSAVLRDGFMKALAIQDSSMGGIVVKPTSRNVKVSSGYFFFQFAINNLVRFLLCEPLSLTLELITNTFLIFNFFKLLMQS